MFGTVPIMTAIVAVLWPTIITTYESCSQRVIVAHSALTRPGARRCATYPKALPPSDEVLQQPDTDCRVADKFQARSFVPHLANQLKTGEHAANAYTLHLSRTHLTQTFAVQETWHLRTVSHRAHGNQRWELERNPPFTGAPCTDFSSPGIFVGQLERMMVFSRPMFRRAAA
jgi:hypothetical protein